MDHFSIWQILITLLGGILSVLSPCIMPVLPGFIAFFTGLSVVESKNKNHRREVLLSTLAFSFGFCLIFAMFGLIAGSISSFLIQNQLILQKIAGIVLIILGVIQTGLIKLNFLQQEFRADQKVVHKNLPHYLRAMAIGALFAISWTPCYGPIIGAIITLGLVSGTAGWSVFYFIIYSIGFTLPLIMMALSLDYFSKFFAKNKQIYHYSNRIAGILLIVIGFLMLTSNLGNIVNWLNFIYTNNKLLFF